jgi:hypothetical protein
MRKHAAATAALLMGLCLVSACSHTSPSAAPQALSSASTQGQPGSAHTKAPPMPRPVTMHTRTTFHLNHAPATGTFTSVGPGRLCASGTLADQVVQPLTDGVVLNETFSCAHGTKAVEIRETIHFQHVARDGTQASTDTWRAVDLGDGMRGSGRGTGVATGCSPVGSNVATSCAHAVGLLTGRLNGGG